MMMSENTEKSFLRYEINGKPAFSTVKIYLENPGQQVVAEGGAMIYMDGQIQVSTKSSGGILSGFKRTLSGESMFLNFFELPPGAPTGSVTFAHATPGDIVHMHLAQGEQWLLNDGAFLCGTPSIKVGSKFSGFKGLFGSNELFFVEITTEAESDLWFGGYGLVERHEIPQGAQFFVDHGIMMAFNAGMQYSVGFFSGKKSSIFGGQGLLLKFQGPGVVYTQSRTIAELARVLEPHLRISGGGHESGVVKEIEHGGRGLGGVMRGLGNLAKKEP